MSAVVATHDGGRRKVDNVGGFIKIGRGKKKRVLGADSDVTLFYLFLIELVDLRGCAIDLVMESTWVCFLLLRLRNGKVSLGKPCGRF